MKTFMNLLSDKRHQPSWLLRPVWQKNFGLLIILFLSIPLLSIAQEQRAYDRNGPISEMAERIEGTSGYGWIYLDRAAGLTDGDLFGRHGAAMGLGNRDRMTPIKSTTDPFDMTHVKYQQQYNGIPVDGGEYILHIKDCLEFLANGYIIENLNLNTNQSISMDEALERAKEAIRQVLGNNAKFPWENPEWLEILREESGNPNATGRPVGERVIARREGRPRVNSNYAFAIRHLIETYEPSGVFQVDIDGRSGAVVNVVNKELSCFHKNNHVHGHNCAHDVNDVDECTAVTGEEVIANGSGPTQYYGTQTIQTKKRGWPNNDYWMKDETRGDGITTKKDGSWWKMTDKDNNWPSDKKQYTQAHWTCAKTWDYFSSVHGLDGTDGGGRKIKIKANWGDTNATYSPGGTQTIKIGKNGSNHLSSMDIMAHEFSHGVTNYSAGLVYSGESGALNESFSDIFGTMVEGWTGAGGFDWTMGEDANFTIRSMSNPPDFGQPDSYNNFVPGGGVHTNSGIQNKWFYLLSAGGTHNGVTVDGIGSGKAAQIAFRNLTVYLNSGSNHPNARSGAIQAAEDIFGKCSPEWTSTINAWAAVKVGPTAPACVEIEGPHFICIDKDLPVTYTAVTNVNTGNFTWSQIHPAWTYTVSGPMNSILTVTHIPYKSSCTIKATHSSGGQDTHFVDADKCLDPDPPFPRDCWKYLR